MGKVQDVLTSELRLPLNRLSDSQTARSVPLFGAASPQILADTAIPSDTKVIVMLAQEFGESDCGYVRPGTVAHRESSEDRVFLLLTC